VQSKLGRFISPFFVRTKPHLECTHIVVKPKIMSVCLSCGAFDVAIRRLVRAIGDVVANRPSKRNTSCWTNAVRRRYEASRRSRTSYPLSMIRPLVGSRKRATKSVMVVFPAPLRPSSAINSPRRTAISKFFNYTDTSFIFEVDVFKTQLVSKERPSPHARFSEGRGVKRMGISRHYFRRKAKNNRKTLPHLMTLCRAVDCHLWLVDGWGHAWESCVSTLSVIFDSYLRSI